MNSLPCALQNSEATTPRKLREQSSRALLMLLALALLLIAGVPTPHANTMRFATGPTMLGGVQVDVEARFTFDPTNHQIMITLLNFHDDPSSITQVLGSLRFTLTA